MGERYPEGYVDKQLARIPMHRQGNLDEAAATLVWLAGAGAGYVTGQTIVANGGYTIG